MRPASMRSPSRACSARKGPLLCRTAGRMLFSPGERCQTTKTEAGRAGGKRPTTFWSASMPPAEAPITTMSLRAMQACSNLQAATAFLSYCFFYNISSIVRMTPSRLREGETSGVHTTRPRLRLPRRLVASTVAPLAHLLVHCLQLFVRGLELLVHGLELLVGRLQLLVGGLQLLVRRLQLLV